MTAIKVWSLSLQFIIMCAVWSKATPHTQEVHTQKVYTQEESMQKYYVRVGKGGVQFLQSYSSRENSSTPVKSDAKQYNLQDAETAAQAMRARGIAAFVEAVEE